MGDWTDDHWLDHDAHVSSDWDRFLDSGDNAPARPRSVPRATPNVERDACMSVEQAREYGSKNLWWILDRAAVSAGVERPFVDLGGVRRATERLSIRLKPGRYLIGAGPHECYREEIEIGADGNPVCERIPCMAVGCDGAIEYAPGDAPPACEPFELNPPRERLCEVCRG